MTTTGFTPTPIRHSTLEAAESGIKRATQNIAILEKQEPTAAVQEALAGNKLLLKEYTAAQTARLAEAQA